MEYLKLDPFIDTDPLVEQAGWCAARVYELFLKVSAQKDLRGRIPPEYRVARYLAKRWNLTAEDLPGIQPEDFISNGMVRMLNAGLAFYDGSDLVLRGWEKFYRPSKSGAERMAGMRARKRDESDAHENAPVTRDAGDEGDATHARTSPTHITPPTPPTEAAASAPSKAFFPRIPEKPEKPDESWGGDDFEAYAQAKRFEEGLPPDKPLNPRKLSAWWSALIMTGFSPRDIRLGFVAFGNDPYWLKEGLPLNAFLSQSQKYIRREPVAHAG